MLQHSSMSVINQYLACAYTACRPAAWQLSPPPLPFPIHRHPQVLRGALPAHCADCFSALAACLGALTTDAAGQLDILGHDRHALGVDRAQVRVLKEADEV